MFGLRLNKRILIVISAFALLAVVVYLIFFTSLSTVEGDVQVFSTVPPDGATEVSIDSSIDIIFVNSVGDNQKEDLDVVIEPSMQFQRNWLTDKQLRILPISPLSYGSGYSISVLQYGEILKEFEFTTSSEPLEIESVGPISEEDSEIITEDALDVQENLNEIQERFPWYFDLPIKGENYVVIFNTRNNQFRISLYVSENTSQSEIDTVVANALSDLEGIGVDLDQYDYYTIFR